MTTLRSYIDWLMNGGTLQNPEADPYMAYSPDDLFGPSMPDNYAFYDLTGGYDPNDLGDIAKSLNIQQDYADIYSDPAILGGQFGEMPTADQYAMPEVTPAKRMLMSAMNSPGSLEQLIVGSYQNNGTPTTALNTLRAKASTPEGLQELRDAGIPFVQGDEFSLADGAVNIENQVPDWTYIRDVAENLYGAAMSDPDPWGEVGMTPQPLKGTLAEWYAKTGTPLPDERYHSQHPALVTPEELDAYLNADAYVQSAQDLMGQYDALRYRMPEPQAYQPPKHEGLPERSPIGGQQPSTAGAGQTARPANRDRLSANGKAVTEFYQPTDATGYLPADRPSPEAIVSLRDEIFGNQPPRDTESNHSFGRRLTNQANQGAFRRYMERPRSQAEDDYADAFMQFASAVANRAQAGRNEHSRQQLAAALEMGGHTPYKDTMAMRRMMLQQSGIGR